MTRPMIGTKLMYVSDTPLGPALLPAEVCGFEDEDKVRIRVYTDNSGGSEWVTHAKFDPKKSGGTWHYPAKA
jgi:hypothetical protein